MPTGRCPSNLSIVALAAVFLASCGQTAHRRAERMSVNPAKQDVAFTPPEMRPSLTTGQIPAKKQQAEKIGDMDAVVRRVVSWHPAIQEAAGLIRQQNEMIADAKSGYLPSVGGGLDLGANNTDSGSWAPKLNVSASQMIYDFGKVSGRVDAETAVYDLRRAEFLATVDDAIRETVLASVEVMRNVSLSGVARRQIEDVASIGKLVEARTERGASTRSDGLQAQARLQAAQSTALEISAERQRWEGALNALLGVTGKLSMRPSFPVALNRACSGPQPDWETVPAVVAAKSRKREADARVGLARAEMLPTVAMEASSRFRTWGKDDDNDYVVGITVKGDLYNGGSFRARQNAARYAAQASEAAVAAGRFESEKTWIQSAAQVGSLSTLLKSLDTRQTMMRETRDLYQTQFIDLGTRTLLDVLNADQEFHAAHFDEINTRYDIYKLNVECAYSAGRLRDVFKLSAPAGGDKTVTKTMHRSPRSQI